MPIPDDAPKPGGIERVRLTDGSTRPSSCPEALF